MVNEEKKQDRYIVECCDTISREIWNTFVFDLFYGIT
jgi:hypothetical protein